MNSLNIWIAFFAAIVIAILLFLYAIYFSRRSKLDDRNLKQRKTEEKRLRAEFPTIFAFVDSIGEIRNEREFEQFLAQLNHLFEVEKRARTIKWSEVKDIETMKAIAYARLMAKKR